MASRGWRLPSPGHFSERGLIIIIALGESIVAIGVGVAKEPITWVIIASVLGLLLASALWWAYFDVSALLGEHALVNEPPATRARLARNAYLCTPAAHARDRLGRLRVEGGAVVRQRQQSS